MISQLSVNAFSYRLTMTTILIASVIALLFVSSSVSAEMGYVGDDVVEIQRVSQGKFRYPRSAARREIEGEVTIEFNVGITGEVVDAFVVEATPPNRFEKNALKYVRSWVYEPLRLNGVPTEVQRIETKVIYRLQN
jgi:protein TonB